jgi:hypothetical protein
MRGYLYLIAIIICLIAFGYWANSERVKERKEKERINQNYISEVNASKSAYTELNIVKGELKQIKPKFDSILKVNNIKEKQVEKIIIYETKIHWDTLPFNRPEPLNDSSNLLITVAAKDRCFTSEGLIDLTNTSLRPTLDDVHKINFSLYNTTIKDNGYTLYYTKRDTTRWVIIRWFYPKKHYVLQKSDCNGQTNIQEIKFIKR